MAFPPVFTNNWDTTFPPDTQLANLLGQDLRNFRTDVMERMSLLSGTFANRPTPEVINASWGGAGYGLLYFSTDNNKIYQWNGAAWVDITSSIGGSSVSVVQVDLTAQGANIGLTTLVVPVANGFYRASAYTVTSRAATTSSTMPNVVISWTDADSSVAEATGIVNITSSNFLGNIGPPTNNPFNIYAKAGVAIKYQ